jgi:hypothetical protein
MKYLVLMQFVPGNDQIWVAQLNPNDPIYSYDTEAEAQAKADELQAADPTGRKYKVSAVSILEETAI